jgi:hypothetical protein
LASNTPKKTSKGMKYRKNAHAGHIWHYFISHLLLNSVSSRFSVKPV